ncbi:hypothetical protein [Halomicronema hongdechloris]|uniref:hypothetical protein n=1 Tax=Halomicronema hongdechloris TaxID=1209493 RepID=UPI0009BC2040|nr:hypothetical protein [Halomicronema hongdechloris]
MGYVSIPDAAHRDLELFETLNPILQALSQLCFLVKDTGSEAYTAARAAYKSIKTSGKGISLDEVIDNLKQQFQRSRRPATAKAE